VARRVGIAGLAVSVLIVLAGIAVVLTTSGASPGAGPYRFDAIFDTAKGIIPGQLVKVAGARAGSVEDVALTPEYRARIEMTIDPRFANFRQNAHCAIQPEGLIGENFVQCDPGTLDSPPLEARAGHPPTLPIERTSIPVSITDLFQIWTLPVRQRVPLIMSTLGAGLAARGEDLNNIIRRANPALEQARKAISTVNKQRHELLALVDSTDDIAGELAGRTDDTAAFIDRTARVARLTGDSSSDIAGAIELAPELLSEARPELQRANQLVRDGTPILRDLRRSAPGLRRAADQLDPLADAAEDALPEVADAAAAGLSATRVSVPVVKTAAKFAEKSAKPSKDLGTTFASLQERGFVESLLTFVYNFAAVSARYDQTSHLVPLLLTVNECSLTFGATHIERCSGNGLPRELTSVDELPEGRRQNASAGEAGSESEPQGRSGTAGGKPAGAADDAAGTGSDPGSSGPPSTDNPVKNLLDFLLK
jgi:virulence factor Mce-like protein